MCQIVINIKVMRRLEVRIKKMTIAGLKCFCEENLQGLRCAIDSPRTSFYSAQRGVLIKFIRKHETAHFVIFYIFQVFSYLHRGRRSRMNSF